MYSSRGALKQHPEPPPLSSDWTTDFGRARESSLEKHIPLLAAFVGLDWCPWCQKLEEEVFSQKEFLEYARNYFIFFLADFPEHKQLPPKVKEQNKVLAKTYAVDAFPTILILDSEGKNIAKTGYRRGGANNYLEHLEGLLKK